MNVQKKSFAPELKQLHNEKVVLDVAGPYLYIGTLEAVDPNSVTLVDADVHNMHESNTGLEKYLIDTRRHGIRINRKRVIVLRRNIMSISPLEAVETY